MRLLAELTIALALSFVAAAPATAQAPPAPAPAAPPVGAPPGRYTRTVVVFLGDSLTAGQGVPPKSAFPALLQDKLGGIGMHVVAVNAGISGDTSAGALRRLGWVLHRKPDVVVIELGANDGLRGLPLDQLENNLRQVVTEVRAAGAKPLLVGMRMPPNYGAEYADNFAAIFPRVAKDMNVPLVPFLLEGVGGHPDLNQPDGIHPTAKGHAVVADTLYPYLLDLLARKP